MLGQGKQTILIRNYKTNVSEFLLYPTVSYALKDDYLDSFQEEYQEFVQSNFCSKRRVIKFSLNTSQLWRKLVEKPVSRIPSIKHYIWTRDHVKNYMTATAFVWILRVYHLNEPYWAEPTPGAIRYANLKEEVS